jgi:phage shock protein E
MRLSWIVILAVIVVIVFLYQYAINSAYRITAAEARLRNRQFDIVLDVRTVAERDLLGYYPGSVHIQSSDLEREMARRFPNKALHILVYCNTGQRARKATETLRSLGYTNVQYIASPYSSLMM